MTNALNIFELAMNIIDEVDEDGNYDTDDTAEYKNRTLGILNVLRGEVYPYSDTYEVREAGIRPIVGKISKFDTPIDLDDFICQTVLPYGLAAHLLLDENPSVANFCNSKYQENLYAAKSRPTQSEDIYDVYSTRTDPVGFAGGGRW